MLTCNVGTRKVLTRNVGTHKVLTHNAMTQPTDPHVLTRNVVTHHVLARMLPACSDPRAAVPNSTQCSVLYM